MLVWCGNLHISPSEALQNVSLVYESDDHYNGPFISSPNLEFLAYVDVNRIPLHLAAGPALRIESRSEDTRQWFANTFSEAFCTDQIQSDIGVLARGSHQAVSTASTTNPRVTELLFYATRQQSWGDPSHLTPRASSSQSYDNGHPTHEQHLSFGADTQLSFYALPLSSDLLYTPTQYTSPLSAVPAPAQTPASPPSKHNHLTTLFDEATSRRKKPRHKLDPAVSSPPPITNSQPETVPNALSLPPLGSPTRPSTSAGTLERTAQSFAGSAATKAFADPSFEARNKQAVSRILMAGMRLHGLSQHRTSVAGARGGGHIPSRQAQAGIEEHVSDAGGDAAIDAEYKGVYHQTYRGALFAFRGNLDSALLSPEAIREVVDRLLALFCGQPL